MSNDGDEMAAIRMTEETKQALSNGANTSSSDEYTHIPIAGRLPVRIKKADWPVKFHCIVPFTQRQNPDKSDTESSLFSWLMYRIAKILQPSPEDDRVNDGDEDDHYCYEFEFLAPTAKTRYSPEAIEVQMTKSGFHYREIHVFLRCHADGRAILYATYKTPGHDICHEGIILLPASGIDEVSTFFRELLTSPNIDAKWSSEYEWISLLLNARRTPIEHLSQIGKDAQFVQFINERSRMVSFSKTDWPIIASSSLGKGEIIASDHSLHTFLYEHLDVHEHKDGRIIVHAYQKYCQGTIDTLGVPDNLFNVFLMSRGVVVQERSDLYSAIQQLVRRMGFAPETGTLCINSLPGEDLL